MASIHVNSVEVSKKKRQFHKRYIKNRKYYPHSRKDAIHVTILLKYIILCCNYKVDKNHVHNC